MFGNGNFGSPVRRLIRGHAFISTVLNEVRNEILQQEISNGVSHSESLVLHFSESVQNCLADFAHSGLCAALVIGVFCGAELYNNWESLQKMSEFAEYVDFRRQARVFVVVFLALFFRVVENAI